MKDSTKFTICFIAVVVLVIATAMLGHQEEQANESLSPAQYCAKERFTKLQDAPLQCTNIQKERK